jgi:hypothetical protein
MNKKRLIVFSVLSALIISGFGIMSVLAASSGVVDVPDQATQFQQRFGITLTDEQKAQVEAKQTEMETKRATELSQWENMTLDQWKAQQIEKINATTQDQFDKIKERQVNMLKNGKGSMGEFKGRGGEKPAE